MSNHSHASPSTPEEVLRLCRSIVGHNDDAGIRVLIEVEGIDGTMTAIRMARRPSVNSARHYLVACIDTARTKQANGFHHHTNGAAAQPVAEPPPTLCEDDYGAVPPDGRPIRNKRDRMSMALCLRDLKALHVLRRINRRFTDWLEDMHITKDHVYSAAQVGKKLDPPFTTAEDEALRKAGKAFPRIWPAGETKAQRNSRRRKFKHQLNRRKTVNLETAAESVRPSRDPNAARAQALVNVLPALPSSITASTAAERLRDHQAWRGADGKKLALNYITKEVKNLAKVHPDIGKEKLPDEACHTVSWRYWRIRSAPRSI
jgi:hypothetical protein